MSLGNPSKKLQVKFLVFFSLVCFFSARQAVGADEQSINVFADVNLNTPTDSNFENLWREKARCLKQGKKPFRKKTLQILKKRHVVLTPGFLHELTKLTGSYFQETIDLLQTHGIKTTKIDPDSSESIIKNSEKIYHKLINLHNHDQLPYIWIGHSKGAAEILYTILKHPDLILDGVVDRVLLIQAAVGGSSLAELSGLDLGLRFISAFTHKGLHSLTPDFINKTFMDAYHEMFNLLEQQRGFDPSQLQAAIQFMRDKIFYIRSQDEYPNFGLGLKFVLGYAGKNLCAHGPNDGLLLVKDQIFMPDHCPFGIDLGILNRTDHIGLVVKHFGNLKEVEQKAFIVVSFESLYP